MRHTDSAVDATNRRHFIMETISNTSLTLMHLVLLCSKAVKHLSLGKSLLNVNAVTIRLS